MTAFLANVAIIIASLALMLGNYWYTFGLWPRSWWAFFGFGMSMIVLMLIREAVQKEAK